MFLKIIEFHLQTTLFCTCSFLYYNAPSLYFGLRSVFAYVSVQRGQLWPGPAAADEADQEDDLLIRRRERRVWATVSGGGVGSGTDASGWSEITRKCLYKNFLTDWSTRNTRRCRLCCDGRTVFCILFITLFSQSCCLQPLISKSFPIIVIKL